MLRKSLTVAAIAILCVPSLAHAAGFDVEPATRAYLDTLQGPARAKSDAYFEGGYWLIAWGALIGIAIDAILLKFRLSARFRDIAGRVFRRPFAVTWLTAVFYNLWAIVLVLPWSIYTSFVREKQYGLMNQDFATWLADMATGAAISLALVPLLFAILYAVIRRFLRGWWLLGTGVVTAFAAFGALVSPVYIAPLFNTYTELPAGPVRDRIVGLAKANQIPADHIYVFDASRQSDRISANVSGLGPTIRISLNDNLLNRTSLPEIAAVMGHEMGHYVRHHVIWLLFWVTLLAAAMLFVLSRLVPHLIAKYGAAWGVRDAGDPASMPVYGIAISVLGLIATPIGNSIIRLNEVSADAFGLDAAREPDGFALTAMKLSAYRKIEPGPIEEMLFFDHPSGAARVRMAMQWKKDNVPDARMVVPPPLPQKGLK